jgi:hypothetical protein
MTNLELTDLDVYWSFSANSDSRRETSLAERGSAA